MKSICNSSLFWSVPVYSAIRPGCLLSAAPPTLMLLHKYGALMQNHNCNLFIPLPSMTSSNESYIFIHQEISYIPVWKAFCLSSYGATLQRPYCGSFISEADKPFQFYCGHTLINPQGGFKVLHFNTKLCLWSPKTLYSGLNKREKGIGLTVMGTVRRFALFVMLQQCR